MAKKKEKKTSSADKDAKKASPKAHKTHKNNKTSFGRDLLFDALIELARHYRTALGAALQDLGIYPGQEQLLLALAKGGPLAPSQLADQLGVRAPTITKMAMRLSASGLVEKTKQEGDGRMVVIALTETGQGLIKKLEKRKNKVEKHLLKDLSKAECKALLRLLEKSNHDGQDNLPV